MLSQDIKPRTLLVCRRADDVAQVVEFTVAGGADGDHTITLDGEDFTHTATGQTAAQKATALAALIDASPLYASSAVAEVITVTASTSGGAFEYAATAPETVTIDGETITDAVNIGTVLDAARAERDDWYGVAIESRTDLDNGRLAEWAVLNNRFAGCQTKTSAVKGAGADWTTPYADNSNVLIGYRANDASNAVLCWLTFTLSADLDRQTTQWSLKVIRGETADNLTTTEKQNLLAKNVNYYLKFAGVPCWRTGKMRSGLYADYRTSLDWVLARMKEAIAAELLALSNINQKIPYDDSGIAIVQNIAFNVLLKGERVGHFVAKSTRVRFTPYADLSAEDRAARRFVFTYGGVFGGAAETFDGTGYFSDDPAQIDSIFGVEDAA